MTFKTSKERIWGFQGAPLVLSGMVVFASVLVFVLFPLTEAHGGTEPIEPTDTEAVQQEPAPSADPVTGAILGFLGKKAVEIALGTGNPLNYTSIHEYKVGIDKAHWHVGDERTLFVYIDACHGNIEAGDYCYAFVNVTGIGPTPIFQLERHQLTELDNNVRRKWTFKFPLEGIEIGQRAIIIELTVCGEDMGGSGFLWLGDTWTNVKKSTMENITILPPYLDPYVTPEPKEGNHQLETFRRLKMLNRSQKTGWVDSAHIWQTDAISTWAPHRINTATAPKDGNQFENHGTITDLDSTWAICQNLAHEGSDHNVPYAWEVMGRHINLKCGIWSDPTNLAKIGRDICMWPLGATTTTVVIPDDPDTTGPVRKLSSGEAYFGPAIRISNEIARPTPSMNGVTVCFHDPVDEIDHVIYPDAEGHVVWADLMLGPTVDISVNTDGDNEYLSAISHTGIPLIVLEGGAEWTFTQLLKELPAPLIEGAFVASDGGFMKVDVYSVRAGYPDVFLGSYTDGPFAIDGRGALDFLRENSLLKFVASPDFNRTIGPDDTILVPVDMTLSAVYLGEIEFDVLPHSTEPFIDFFGAFYYKETGLPAVGLILEVYDYPAGTTLIACDTTDAEGGFFLTVPNGPAYVDAPNASDFDLPPSPPLLIDFGANGLPALDIGMRGLLPMPSPFITIEKTHNTYQGQYEAVSITTEDSWLEMGGFDFLIAYDASALSFTSAEPGQLLEDCGWEYFTYRYGADGNCGDACPSGLLRIIAIAETPNGPNHPSCYGPPDADPYEMVQMMFLVTNDRTFECQYIPIKFFWDDCGDNTISSVDGEVLYVSDHVYDFEGTDITDWTFGFPTYFGVQEECLVNGDPDKPTAIQLVDYINGGIDIVCADSIDARGDINLNGVPFEIADAVLLANYYVYGLSVFTVNLEGQIAASDVNADGMPLSVADLVYLIRIITGDASPYPKLTPVTADADLVNGVLSVNANMGVAFIVVEGNSVPNLLADNMEMMYNFDGTNTRILLYSLTKGQSFSGDFLEVNGNVVKLEMATYDGAPIAVKLMPSQYTLHQNFPNPFNPSTEISFSLPAACNVRLTIYNLMGQEVATVASGSYEAGHHTATWDGSAAASGVYFYKLEAGGFVETKKMVLLK